ncbi:pantoate--beta-alanine ligase [Metapseudomonas resinovorans]|uniref:Pantothenate synthetase n=1 Tax=Metapseudomonas resinovorans NBRC 106553 TaxID=1245471 RepID=S6ARF5_METRE|nr:pantoate--beta-alanine ligase [Pseudomonas resinovorans]BAN48483.1 pantothenate synthetase [Pseudomonas resinovorans NBRC 106553]
MITTDSIQTLLKALQNARDQKKRIGLVPTMGNLHEGHISLLELARRESDFVVTSLFVNPMQFGPQEDLQSYPRTPSADQKALSRAGCAALFAPSVKEMYPNGLSNHCSVLVPGVSGGLCGESRPGHFQGVATVVTKLFNIVQPDIAVFGQKDYQQLAVIRAFTQDLNFATRILAAPTFRAPDGLALSSRNGYLSPVERDIAPLLYRCIRQIAEAVEQGERDYASLIKDGKTMLEGAGFRMDYLEIRAARTLEAPAQQDKSLVILVAAFIGTTRLIDNIECCLP